MYVSKSETEVVWWMMQIGPIQEEIILPTGQSRLISGANRLSPSRERLIRLRPDTRPLFVCVLREVNSRRSQARFRGYNRPSVLKVNKLKF